MLLVDFQCVNLPGTIEHSNTKFTRLINFANIYASIIQFVIDDDKKRLVPTQLHNLIDAGSEYCLFEGSTFKKLNI